MSKTAGYFLLDKKEKKKEKYDYDGGGNDYDDTDRILKSDRVNTEGK